MLRFPRAKFADTNTIQDQVKHIESELIEILEEFARPPVNYENVMMELLDLIHSAETGVRILVEQKCINLEDAAFQVQFKNRTRGYYR